MNYVLRFQKLQFAPPLERPGGAKPHPIAAPLNAPLSLTSVSVPPTIRVPDFLTPHLKPEPGFTKILSQYFKGIFLVRDISNPPGTRLRTGGGGYKYL